MGAFLKSLDIDRLSVEERLALAEDIWDSIAVEGSALPPTEAQRNELDRRIDEHEANPENVVPWEDIKASIS